MFGKYLGGVIAGKIQDLYKLTQNKRNASAFLTILPSTKSAGLDVLSGQIKTTINIWRIFLTTGRISRGGSFLLISYQALARCLSARIIPVQTVLMKQFKARGLCTGYMESDLEPMLKDLTKQLTNDLILQFDRLVHDEIALLDSISPAQ